METKMIKKLDTKDIITVAKIVNLQKKSYIIEADLIDFYDIPPLRDSVESIMETEETFYGFMHGDILAGIISYKLEENTVDIHRVAVDPSFFRRGIAKQLIKYLEENVEAERIAVATGAKNYPAVNLYLSLGFKKIEESVVNGALLIAFFEK